MGIPLYSPPAYLGNLIFRRPPFGLNYMLIVGLDSAPWRSGKVSGTGKQVGCETRKIFVDRQTTNFVCNFYLVTNCSDHDIDSFKIMPSDEYQEALLNATAFIHKIPEEKTTAAA